MGQQHRKTLNLWVAYTMPVIMASVVGFASWVFVALVCVHYLFLTKGRTHTAIALITLYAFFFLLLASSYLRTAVTLTTNPGYVPKGPKHAPTPAEKAQEQLDGSATDDEDETATSVFERTVSVPFPGDDGGHHLDRMASGASLTTVLRNGPPPSTCSTAPLTHPPAPAPDPTQGRSYNNMWIPPRPAAASLPSNLAAFLEKEIYVCESDGLPRYCRYCNCWKPDRSHHCSEIGRCVMRMDHFCPWVGGVVAESSFRYFYQVVVYGTLYCVFLIAAMAACIHNRTSAGDGLDPKWIAVIALASMFGLFSIGMATSTTQLIVSNTSTIDTLSAKTKVYQLAIHDPNPPSPGDRQGTYRVWLPADSPPGIPQRCYALVKTNPGENPWLLPSLYENFKESLGGGEWWTWFSLWGVRKPGTGGGMEGWYQWNQEVVGRLRKEAGIRAPGGEKKKGRVRT